MKLLLDQGAAGYAAEHVGDIGLARAADSEILDHARRKGQLVVTLDADFHTLMAVSGAAKPSVIRIRIQALRGGDIAAILENIIAACRRDLEAGALVTVTQRRVGLRRLPIRPKPRRPEPKKP